MPDIYFSCLYRSFLYVNDTSSIIIIIAMKIKVIAIQTIICILFYPVFEEENLRIDSWGSSTALSPRNKSNNFFVDASKTVRFAGEPVEQWATGIANTSILLESWTCCADHTGFYLRAVVVDAVRSVHDNIVCAHQF